MKHPFTTTPDKLEFFYQPGVEVIKVYYRDLIEK